MEEKRQAVRVARRVPISKINGQAVADAYLLNLSPLGVSIEDSLPVKGIDLVEVTFVLPGKEEETRHLGEVVWLDLDRPREGRYVMGISFLRPYREFAG